MTERTEKTDPYSRIPWVYVSRAEAHAHPKGQLGPVLYAICGFLILTGALKTVVFFMAGEPLWSVAISGVLPVFAGLGLYARMPFALVLTILMAGLTLFLAILGMRALAEPGVTEIERVIPLIDAVIAAAICFHLMDGDRPNLIYRHRYRKYSVLREGK